MNCAWLVKDGGQWQRCPLPATRKAHYDDSQLCRLHALGEFAAMGGAIGHDDIKEVVPTHMRKAPPAASPEAAVKHNHTLASGGDA